MSLFKFNVALLFLFWVKPGAQIVTIRWFYFALILLSGLGFVWLSFWEVFGCFSLFFLFWCGFWVLFWFGFGGFFGRGGLVWVCCLVWGFLNTTEILGLIFLYCCQNCIWQKRCVPGLWSYINKIELELMEQVSAKAN